MYAAGLHDDYGYAVYTAHSLCHSVTFSQRFLYPAKLHVLYGYIRAIPATTISTRRRYRSGL